MQLSDQLTSLMGGATTGLLSPARSMDTHARAACDLPAIGVKPPAAQ
ncbi:hypothetical protein M1L60_31735 [Actinoplanes sp. TRM 88003]|uniref:Uncharacterized protein n=1 Tax=Paractinoplanes aksuensis TaxID=2939490 RepID=A0ABT1DWB6_9ACTN|nr:hypothetical protein [Actinoplanes aksuensis]MCO8275162.1 hypothetical protein [Actinoplanes aksuensis]